MILTRKSLLCLLTVCLLCSLFSCQSMNSSSDATQTTAITDALGHVAYLDADSRVVSGYASFAECWLLAGGTLVGVTEDAVEEHGLDVGDAAQIGTVKHIHLETLVALNPDYVILSADLAAHLALQDSLDAMGIPYGYFRVDTFDDYKTLMAQFCAIQAREDLYTTHVLDIEAKIHALMERIPSTNKSVLLIRAYSTGMKAKTDDTLAGQILREFGLTNIADDHEMKESMLEDLSMEHIIQVDPDYIFAISMGNEAGALQYLQSHIEHDAAWRSLSAVQNGHFYTLPKELFHYKPNNRWSDSYEYLANCIFPDLLP